MKYLFLISTFFGLTLVTYQNCGNDLRLKKPETPPLLPSTVNSIGGNFCTKASASQAQQMKIVFVIDMSLSNIGKIVSGTFVPGGTDPNKIRFAAIDNFISTCDAAKKAKFALMSFRDDYSAHPSGLKFVEGSEAQGQLPFFKSQQDTLLAQASTAYQQVSGKTNYQPPLEKVRDLINAEIILDGNNAKNTNYLIFFVTDGMPSDNQVGIGPTPSPTDCMKNPNYKSTIDDIMLAGFSSASSIKIQPLLYGVSSMDPNDLGVARCVLNNFAKWGDSQSITEIVDSQINYCPLLAQPSITQFRKTSFGVVNLNSLMIDKQLAADSDSDGLADSAEVALGYDPTKSRTNGKVLDGICQMVGGLANCNPSGCDPNTFVATGLNECDLQVLGLNKGLDQDKDTIPDLVEILKGLSPQLDDAFMDRDNDGLENLREIALGSNPNQPDKDVDPKYVLEVTTKKTGTCETNQEQWEFSLPKFPLVSVPKYSMPPAAGSEFDFSHESGENLIFVYYQVEPTNSPVANPPKLFFGAVSPVNDKGLVKGLTFKLLGKSK